MSNEDKLLISETFESLQGEGRNIGMPCTFLRLAYCNLSCVWCDSKYTWDWKNYDPKVEIKQVPIIDVAETIRATRSKNLVITGGEPMIQQGQLVRLIDELNDGQPPVGIPKHLTDRHFEIETAGTIMPTDALIARIHLFTVSPKLKNSGNPIHRRFIHQTLDQFASLASYNKSVFKFVVTGEDDLKEVDQIVELLNLPKFAVYVMPEGISMDTLNERAQALTQAIIERGYRLTMRLHIALFGNKRGV